MSDTNPSAAAAPAAPAAPNQAQPKYPGTAPLNAPAQAGAAHATPSTSAKAARRQTRKQH